MSKLTAAQLSLIKKGLATPEDFGAQGSEALSPETTNAITANLSPQQKSLIAKGLASPEDFTQREAASPAEDPENAARLAAYQQDAADWRGEGFGLVDTLTNLPAAVVAGRRAADTTAAEMQRNLVGRQFAPGMTEDNLVDAGLNTIGAIYDAATTDRTFSESLLDRAVTSRDELADARRRQAEAQQDVEALADRSTTLRTVADAAGSAPESVLSALGGIGGGAAGAVGGPTGIAAGAIVGSAAGSIPMARKAFYAAWDEAFKVARAGGMSEEDAAALADEQAFEQAATEFGVEAVTGAVGGGVGKLFGKVGGNLLRRTAIVGGGRVALEAGSEAITPYAQNAVRAGSAAVEGDERQARVIDSMVKEWNDPTLREEATRGLLAGGLGAGLIIAPTTAIEQAGQIRAEKADALRKKEAAELKADVEAIARSLGTPDAGRLAQTFSAGVDKATELDPLAGIEVDQLDVANESFQDTRFDRATQTIDNTLNLLDQSASNADTSRPMRLQNEERKAAVAEIDALRTYIKSVAPLAEAKALGRNERGNLKRAIDRLNFLEAQEQGRKDAGTAKEIRSRLANAPDAELLTVAGELDPSQNFTDITGPDLSRLSTPAPVPAKAPRAAANNALGVTQSAVQQGINEGRKQADKDAAKARAEEQNRPLQELEQRAANQQAFVRDYVRSNPTATDEEVQNALSTWEQTTQQLTATTPQVSPQTSLEARAAAALEASRNNTEKKARDDARKTENKAIADAIKAGITDPKAIAERVLAARQTAPAPATTTTATDTEQETLSFDPEAFLTERQTGRVPTSNNTRASMGNPEFEELLRQFEANEAAAVSSNVRDFNITDIAGGDNVHKRANIEGGVRGLMNTVATTEGTRETPVKGMLARRLAPLMEMLGVKVEFRDSPIYLNGDKSNGSAAGLWVPGENKILVYSGMDETSTNEFVLHEGVHSVLQGVYKDAAKFGEAGVKAKQAIDDGIAALEVARNDGRLAAAIEKVAANSPPSQRQATKDFLNMLLMSKAEGVIFRPDGTVEPDEFIAYGSTNRDVQNVFKEIKTGKRVGVSIWDKFKQAVRSILNFSGDDTVLDRVMEGTEGLISAAENNQAQTKRSADANRQEAVAEATGNERAGMTRPTASTEEQLLEGRGEGALAGEDSGVERALQTVERSGNVGAFAVNALVRKDARIPVTMREETEAASNRNQAKVLEAMAMVRKMNALVRGNRGSLSTAAALNEFGADFNTLNKLRQKIRDKGPDPAVEKQITDLQEQMKFRWGEAYSILERAQSQIDEQSLVLMEEIIKAAPIGRDGKRQLTQEQIRQLNAIKANLGMYVSREFANNSANLREEHIKTFSDDSSPRVASAKREARKYLREKSLNIPEDPAVLMRQSIDSLRDLASVWVADMPTASKEDIVAALMEVRNDPDLYNEETLDAMVEKELNAIIEGSDASVTNRRYQSKAIDDRILKEREFVPQELLTVMGEVNNAGLQLLTTLHRQSMLIENMKAYAGMYDKLKGRAVFDNAATAPRNFVQLKGNYGKMTGKFVHPNVAEVLGRSETLKEDFTKAFSDPAQLSNAIFTAAGKVSMGAKAVTLLPNLLAWTMNLYGSIMLPVATGSVRSIPKMPKALMTAMIKMPGVWARKDISPDVLEVFRRGLEDSGHVAEITSESLRIAAETFRAPPGRVQSFLEGTSGAVGATMRLAFDMYAAMDLWSKFAIYYGEVDFLTSLNKELPAAERMSEESIRRVAAEWTKEVTPSYERTIPAANALERVGLGFFMRYNAEVWRNSVNNLSRVNKEFALARSFAERGLDRASMKLNERATTRLIGATVATISYSTVAGIAGSTMASALRAAFGLEDEEDDEVAQLVAEAAKQDNSFLAQKPLVVVGKDSAGWMVFDASRPLPQAPFQQTVHSLFSAMTGGEEDFSDVAEQLYGNFVSLSPPVTYIMNYGGYRDRKPIWVKEDGPVKRWMAENNIPDDGMIAKTMQALNILTPAQFDNALIDKEQPLATWFGTPPSRLDTTKMLQSYSINEELRAQRDLLVTDLKQPATLADEEEIKAIAARSIAVDLRRFQSVTARIRLARKSGMTDRDIVKTLEGTLGDRGSGLTSEDIRLMMNGNFMPSTLSQRTLDAAMRDLMNREGANREDIRRKFAVLRTELNTLRAAVKNGEFNPEE